MEKIDEKPTTWYGLHKEQIKLIQWLLYHLKKETPQKPSGGIQKLRGDFSVEFA
jgi:hypothetical protein